MKAKQNSCELDLACGLLVCTSTLQKPLQAPPCSLIPCVFLALPFVLCIPLAGLPNPILSIDLNPNSYLTFKIKLKVCCVACLAFQQQVGETRISSGLTCGLDTKSWEVSQGRDHILELQVRGTESQRTRSL